MYQLFKKFSIIQGKKVKYLWTKYIIAYNCFMQCGEVHTRTVILSQSVQTRRLRNPALPSWPMQTPLWTTHESPIQQLLSATLYLEKYTSIKPHQYYKYKLFCIRYDQHKCDLKIHIQVVKRKHGHEPL